MIDCVSDQILDSHAGNNSGKNHVHNLYKLDSEVNNNVRMKVSARMRLPNDFNPKVKDALRPNGSKYNGLREWEKNVLMHLNNVNLAERDDRKTSYVKFKLFKRDIYGLALVDTGNLVKGTLVSSEFWKKIGGKMLEESNARVNTAEKADR